jgi:hypothetical protein
VYTTRGAPAVAGGYRDCVFAHFWFIKLIGFDQRHQLGCGFVELDAEALFLYAPDGGRQQQYGAFVPLLQRYTHLDGIAGLESAAANRVLELQQQAALADVAQPTAAGPRPVVEQVDVEVYSTSRVTAALHCGFIT